MSLDEPHTFSFLGMLPLHKSHLNHHKGDYIDCKRHTFEGYRQDFFSLCHPNLYRGSRFPPIT